MGVWASISQNEWGHKVQSRFGKCSTSLPCRYETSSKMRTREQRKADNCSCSSINGQKSLTLCSQPGLKVVNALIFNVACLPARESRRRQQRRGDAMRIPQTQTTTHSREHSQLVNHPVVRELQTSFKRAGCVRCPPQQVAFLLPLRSSDVNFTKCILFLGR
jgi:hypothetical protein